MTTKGLDPHTIRVVLKEVEDILSECYPQGQYERFNDHRLTVNFRALKKSLLSIK